MSTHRQILYHIVFATRGREKTIDFQHDRELYQYIAGIILNKNCKPHQINGMPDHIHILCDLHPSIALADIVKDVKVASSVWLKASGKFSRFASWQEGYGAFTVSFKDRGVVAKYVRQQKEHHQALTFYEEYKSLLLQHEVSFDERYLL